MCYGKLHRGGDTGAHSPSIRAPDRERKEAREKLYEQKKQKNICKGKGDHSIFRET